MGMCLQQEKKKQAELSTYEVLLTLNLSLVATIPFFFFLPLHWLALLFIFLKSSL